MRRRGVSLDQLVAESGVPRATIDRWRRGQSRSYHWEGVVKVAAGLKLNRVETERLLRAMGQPSLNFLVTEAPVNQRPLLSRWITQTRNNLPGGLTSFVGREDETLELAGLLCLEDVRLVTLTGPGGAGKTRLSLHVANELQDVFPDGIFFVPLATVTDPSLVAPAIARTLEVRDVAGQSSGERLADYLRERQVLLVLDNLEQVVEAGPEITSLLRSSPHLKVLATSRIPLRVSGEHERPVSLLSLPEHDAGPGEIRASPAITLFVDRAVAVSPAFALTTENVASVVEICERLDGSPLAIELASARLRRFSPEALLERFPGRLDLGSDGPRDVPQRQRSLRATIDWSYRLLSSDTQELFRRLSVFSGGWTANAAMVVCGEVGDGLDELAEGNLIVTEPDGRFAMLETIREYALERLAASADEDDLRLRHARYFLGLAESAERYVPQARQQAWLAQIDRERVNLNAALAWAADQESSDLSLRLTGALWPYWHEYGYFREGSSWIDAAMNLADGAHGRLLGSVLNGAMHLALSQGDVSLAHKYADLALALWREVDDPHGVALVLSHLGSLLYVSADYAGAERRYQASLDVWRSLDEPLGVALCSSELGILFSTTGQFERAAVSLRNAHAIYEREQDRVGIARSYLDLGLSAMLQEDLASAIELLEQGISLCRKLGDNPHLSWGLFYLGTSLCFAGQFEAALVRLTESLQLKRDNGDKYGVFYTLLGFAAVAVRLGQAERSAMLCGSVSSILELTGLIMTPAVQSIYYRETRLIQDQMSSNQFDAAFAFGRQMTPDEAVRFALDVPG